MNDVELAQSSLKIRIPALHEAAIRLDLLHSKLEELCQGERTVAEWEAAVTFMQERLLPGIHNLGARLQTAAEDMKKALT